MTSKALKAALLTSLLTGSDASIFSRRRTPSGEHNERARKHLKKYEQKTEKEREENITRRNL